MHSYLEVRLSGRRYLLLAHLLEGDDEHVDVLNLVPEGGHQVLDGLLLLQEPVSVARGVDHCEPRSRGVAHPVALVCARPLGDAVQARADFEAAVVEAPSVVIFVSAYEDIGEAGLAYPD